MCLPGSEFESWTNLFSFLFSCFLPLLFLLCFSFFFLLDSFSPYVALQALTWASGASAIHVFLAIIVLFLLFLFNLFYFIFFRMTKMSLPAPGPEIVGKADRKKCAKNAR